MPQAEPWPPSGVTVIADRDDFRDGLEAYPVPRPMGHPKRDALRNR